MIAKPKKIPKKKLEKHADNVARYLVHSRGYCEAAGLDKIACGGGLQWCHIVGRANHRLRWEMYNALCMCQGHHLYYTHHPYEWVRFIDKNFPENAQLIEAHRNEIWDGDYEVVNTRLQAELLAISK